MAVFVLLLFGKFRCFVVARHRFDFISLLGVLLVLRAEYGERASRDCSRLPARLRLLFFPLEFVFEAVALGCGRLLLRIDSVVVSILILYLGIFVWVQDRGVGLQMLVCVCSRWNTFRLHIYFEVELRINT